MEKWEANLRRVDRIICRWMCGKGMTETNPPKCAGILEQEKLYSPTDRPGRPLRDDLRAARSANGVRNNERFIYNTEHLKFKQEAKSKAWRIYLK